MKRNIDHNYTTTYSSFKSNTSLKSNTSHHNAHHVPLRVDPFVYSSQLTIKNYLSTHRSSSHGKIHLYKANLSKVKEVSVQEIKYPYPFAGKRTLRSQEHKNRLPTIPENDVLVILPSETTSSLISNENCTSVVADSNYIQNYNLMEEKHKNTGQFPGKSREERTSLKIEHCLQISMIITNILNLMCGILVIALTAWVTSDARLTDEVIGNTLKIAKSTIFFLGAMAILTSLLGLLGSINEGKCILVMYFVVLLLALSVLVTGGILLYIYNSQILESVKEEMLNSLKTYPDSQRTRDTWDQLQKSINRGHCTVYFAHGCLQEAKFHLRVHASIIGGIAAGIISTMVLGMILSCSLYKVIL